jgi:hypothetical protein
MSIQFDRSELPSTLVSRSFLISMLYLVLTIGFTYAWWTVPAFSLLWILAIAAGLCTIFMWLMTFLDSPAWMVIDDDDEDEDQFVPHIVEPRRRPRS